VACGSDSSANASPNSNNMTPEIIGLRTN
jgi:hypothetical protein